MELNTKSIFVAMVGKPNVGKSSLMNLILGEKIAIVTQKPQTTRTSITGILTKGATQFVFMDTPGIHTPRTKLGERMVKTSHKTIAVINASIFKPRFFINLFLMPVYSSPCVFSSSFPEESCFESSLIFLLMYHDLHCYKVYLRKQWTLFPFLLIR